METNYQNNCWNFNPSSHDKHIIDVKGHKISLHISSHKAMLEELWTKANLSVLNSMHGFMKNDINDYQKVSENNSYYFYYHFKLYR
jgi:hypothetical protein